MSASLCINCHCCVVLCDFLRRRCQEKQFIKTQVHTEILEIPLCDLQIVKIKLVTQGAAMHKCQNMLSQTVNFGKIGSHSTSKCWVCHTLPIVYLLIYII